MTDPGTPMYGLEGLAGTLNGKAALSFRVTYTVGGNPIEALVVAGDAGASTLK